ncbi:MAG TPA: tetratricopeptide repeat protein [Kofleriaceae bacterium]
MLCAAMLLSAVAMAEPKTADDWYSEGETQYNLGNFDKAADAFKQGYALESIENKKPAYLYNVAQAYRQARKCKDASFFYKRYLSLKDQDTAKPLNPDKRKEIEGWIAELDECEKSQDAIANKRPDSTISPNTNPTGGTGTHTTGTGTTGTTSTTGTGTTGTGTTGTTATGTGKTGTGTKVADGGGEGGGDDDDSGGGIHAGVTTEQPKMLSLRFTGGVSKISAGDLTVPVEPTFNLFGGYPIAVNEQLEIDIGADINFTPVPYTDAMKVKKTAQFIGVLADVGAVYTVAPKIGLRGDLGVGVNTFGGISDMGNPFTQNGAPTTGALGMLAVRVGVAADYAVTPNVLITVAPIAFTYSPAKDGLRSDIKSLTRLDFMLGVGYRM